MADESKLHIAMFPWLAFGHLIPFLELSKLIAQKGHKISFLSTPRNIDRLPKLPPNLVPSINFVKLPLPRVPNLLEGQEATIDVPIDKVQYLKLAFDGLKDPLNKFLETSDIDYLLHDFAPYWLPDIAASLGIPIGYFSIFMASACCFLTRPPYYPIDDRTEPQHFTVPPKWIPFPSTLKFRLFEILRVLESIEGDRSNVSDMYRVEQAVRGCQMIAVRSCMEFEPQWLHLLQEMHGKPVVPVGLLATTDHDTGEESGSWSSMKDWLDKQEKGSVVYVAFGSEAKPSQVELTEIALGLELSGLPFFWVLRKRRGSTDDELIELPDGFEERTKGRGVVFTSWAPQLKILAHDSVGGFLTHSGWSSVVESLHHGRSLILLTFLADQGLNARLFEERKIGYPIPRNEVDGSFTRDSVAESLELVMVKEEGKIYRDKAKELKALFSDKRIQDRQVDNLLSFIANNRRTSQ